MVGSSKTQSNDGEEQERHATDGGGARGRREQEAGMWWGRARDRRVVGKSRRDTQLMGEANDGEEREAG